MQNCSPLPGHLLGGDAPVQIAAVVLVFSGLTQARKLGFRTSTSADKHDPAGRCRR